MTPAGGLAARRSRSSIAALPAAVQWREQVAREEAPSFAHEEYWAPVPGFGDP